MDTNTAVVLGLLIGALFIIGMTYIFVKYS